jgi:hypothetical protein
MALHKSRWCRPPWCAWSGNGDCFLCCASPCFMLSLFPTPQFWNHQLPCGSTVSDLSLSPPLGHPIVAHFRATPIPIGLPPCPFSSHRPDFAYTSMLLDHFHILHASWTLDDEHSLYLWNTCCLFSATSLSAIPWITVLQKLMVTLPIKEFPRFIEPNVSILFWHHITGSYPEPDESSDHTHNLFLLR